MQNVWGTMGRLKQFCIPCVHLAEEEAMDCQCGHLSPALRLRFFPLLLILLFAIGKWIWGMKKDREFFRNGGSLEDYERSLYQKYHAKNQK
jgi:hypothetical protein